MSTPTIPPRPTRASAAGPTAVKDNMPQVPPRPTRKTDPSPAREEHTRSPFNELPIYGPPGSKRRSGSHLATTDVPARPPSVSLPSVGQEGAEYASYDQLPSEAHGASGQQSDAPAQTVNVPANTVLHQPTASVPQSTAKSRIANVTRTDSTQAAAAGIGRARPVDDVHNSPAEPSSPLGRVTSRTEDLMRVPSADLHPLRQQTSFNRSTSSLRQSRPGSVHEGTGDYEHEQGIPAIGKQIPLYPNAGDVQAPSPAQTQTQHTPGVGFFNDGSARAHSRKKSGRHQFGPPDSYGLHGHHENTTHHDQFERDWCAKHPEQAAKEGYNVYGNLNTPRPEFALSSEQLNRLVNQGGGPSMGRRYDYSACDHGTDTVLGADPNMIGTPTHEIAFSATQEYTSRMTSPKPSPAPLTPRGKRQSSGSQTAVESPLRKASFPFQDGRQSAVDGDDEDTIHVDDTEFRANKVTGGGPQDGAIDLGHPGRNNAEDGDWIDERGEGTPILASDEVLKRPGSAFMQPAVNPEVHHDDEYYDSDHRPDSRRSSMRVPSRPNSRPNSMHGDYHGGNLHRFMSHEEHHGSGMGTPLEEIEEYEPLFPEGEVQSKPKPKSISRPGLEHHHFPSQDIWEDAPSSVHYSTIVETPEPPPEMEAVAPPPPTNGMPFETPEQEQQRKEENPDDMTSDSKTFAKPHFKAGVQDDMHRPGVQRFPSQDIWEDTPDSMRLVTTVSAPQDEARSPPEERPTTSAIPTSQDDAEARATTGLGSSPRKPSIPSRPQRKSKLAEDITTDLETEGKGKEVPDLGAEKQVSPTKGKAPSIPERPKPTVPTRPARTSRSAQGEGAPLAKSTSTEEQAVTDAAPVPKAKPVVPARPGGDKFAALKSGFMSDLNNRLKLGPQGPPPKPEPEVNEEAEKAPLADARKSRAKGPARRKPAASPSAAPAEQTPAFAMSTPMTLWSIDERDQLRVPGEDAAEESKLNLPALEKVLSENEAANTTEPTLAQPKSPETAKASLASHTEASIGAEGDQPEPSISPETAQDQKSVAVNMEASLAEAEAAPASAEDAVSQQEAPVVSKTNSESRPDAAMIREKAPEEPSIASPEA